MRGDRRLYSVPPGAGWTGRFLDEVLADAVAERDTAERSQRGWLVLGGYDAREEQEGDHAAERDAKRRSRRSASERCR